MAVELSQKHPCVKVIKRESEKGLATAVIRGWQAARGRVLGLIDGDLQHPPHTLIKLWQEIEQGADIAIASRNLEGGGVSEWSIARRFLSRGAQMLGLLILPEVIGRISDPMSGYFMVRRDALSERIFNPLGYKILIEVMARGNICWIGEVGYIFQERKIGESKVTHQQYLEYILHLVRLRLDLWQIDRFLRFGISGFSGVFVNLGVLYLLREFFDLGLTRSAIIAAEIAIALVTFWNYWFNLKLSWRTTNANHERQR